jgi:hypothetical protein
MRIPARFADLAGRRQPTSVEDAWYRGRRLGAGEFAEVRSAGRSKELAIKRVNKLLESREDGLGNRLPESTPPSRLMGLENEVNMQARLGNEFGEDGEHLGIMPPVRQSAVMRQPGVVDEATGKPVGVGYIEMPNLEREGYRTLQQLSQDPAVPEDYVAKVAAEAALNRAWAARGGVAIGDPHAGNSMALTPGQASPKADGSRVQLIDAGYAMDLGSGEAWAAQRKIAEQGAAVARGYTEIGMEPVGRRLQQAINEELQGVGAGPDGKLTGSLALPQLLVDGALSDLANRVEGFDSEAWAAVRGEVARRKGMWPPLALRE